MTKVIHAIKIVNREE